jgi:hypothetical protein
MSEAMLSMVLDIEVERHKREVAAGFKEARDRLLPKQEPTVAKQLYELMRNADNQSRWSQADLAPHPNPYQFGNQASLSGQIGPLGFATLGLGSLFDGLI